MHIELDYEALKMGGLICLQAQSFLVLMPVEFDFLSIAGEKSVGFKNC